MSKKEKEKQVDDFEDMFEDSFEETEQTASNEAKADLGTAEFSDEDYDMADSSGGAKKYSGLMIYGIGGVIIVGLAWALYRQFVPAAPKVTQRAEGPTRVIKSFPVPKKQEAKPVEKKKVEAPKPKAQSGFVVNKDNLQSMITNFSKSTSNALESTQKSLSMQIANVNKSVMQMQQETEKMYKSSQGKEYQNNIHAIKNLASEQGKQINSLVKKVDTLDSRFDKMHKILTSLNQNMAKIQVDLKLVIAQKAAQVQKLALRAVVPGRAWLVDGKGKTVSVSVGDELPYYGKVVKIDSKINTVSMSTGYVFS